MQVKVVDKIIPNILSGDAGVRRTADRQTRDRP
jgi:hypothetical protein